MTIIREEVIITASQAGHTRKFQLYRIDLPGGPKPVVVIELESGLSGSGSDKETAIINAFKRLGIT